MSAGRRARPPRVRGYLAAIVDQGLWSALSLGLNLGLARAVSPDQYGACVFWLNCGYTLVSLQNALTVTHLVVLPPGPASDPRRLEIERLMHAVQLCFLSAVALISGVAVRFTHGAFAAWTAALFLPAFLGQQYTRSLAFSRGRPGYAAAASAAVVLLAATAVPLAVALRPASPAAATLAALAAAYGLVALVSAAQLCGEQFTQRRWVDLRAYGAFASHAGWVFLGVSSTELLARFYSFAVAGWGGPRDLAVLSATQIPMRPLPLLANAWSVIARPELARKREAGAWRGYRQQVALSALAGAALAAPWTIAVTMGWSAVSHVLFGGRYAGFGWMAALWGVSGALSGIQTVMSVGLQGLRAFKPLALANAAASLVAAGCIVWALQAYGAGGALFGTAVGQALECVVMALLLRRWLSRRGAAG